MAKKKKSSLEVASDDDWKIRDDARTLASAKEIQSDKPRYKKAVGMAKKLAAEQLQEITAMRKVANSKT